MHIKEEEPSLLKMTILLAVMSAIMLILSPLAYVDGDVAVESTGLLATYDAHDKVLTLQDGRHYAVWIKDGKQATRFAAAMEQQEPGTPLSFSLSYMPFYRLLGSDEPRCLVACMTETETLFRKEDGMKHVNQIATFTMAFGCAGAACIVLLLLIAVLNTVTEKKRLAASQAFERNKETADTAPLRDAAVRKWCRTLAETEREGYRICYRRVRNFTNELVINGRVYDEKRGWLEASHALFAVVDGHRIEAGLMKGGGDRYYSYIRFDGRRATKKKRDW